MRRGFLCNFFIDFFFCFCFFFFVVWLFSLFFAWRRKGLVREGLGWTKKKNEFFELIFLNDLYEKSIFVLFRFLFPFV